MLSVFYETMPCLVSKRDTFQTCSTRHGFSARHKHQHVACAEIGRTLTSSLSGTNTQAKFQGQPSGLHGPGYLSQRPPDSQPCPRRISLTCLGSTSSMLPENCQVLRLNKTTSPFSMLKRKLSMGEQALGFQAERGTACVFKLH